VTCEPSLRPHLPGVVARRRAALAHTWSKESDEIAPRTVLTERARAEICRRVGPGEHSVAEAAQDFGVSWHAAMSAVRAHGRPRVDDLARLGAPAAIGLDETSSKALKTGIQRSRVSGVRDLASLAYGQRSRWY
jgi:hypothetical protein